MKYIKQPNNIINLMSILSILFINLQLNSCNNYKKFFAAKNHEYTNIQPVNKISSESKKFPLIENDRYSIPAIANQTPDSKIVDLLPPNYSDNSEPENLVSNTINAKNTLPTTQDKLEYSKQ